MTESIHLQDNYILSFYESLDCARSLTAAILYRYADHLQLVGLEFNPLDYNDLVNARDSLAATKFLSKAKFLKTGNDLEKASLDTYFSAEQECKATNIRIRASSYSNEYMTLSCLAIAKWKIAEILGSIDAHEFVNACNWGPGATTKLPRRLATPQKKFDLEDQITPEAYDFVKDWFHSAYPAWVVEFKIQPCSKIVTVPKNAKTNRTIAIEPGLNLWFQKGVGAVIRSRLKAAGIDLNNQCRNQEFSRLASKFDHLATIDFSSASDTIAKELVRELLPVEWFSLLDCLRSKASSLGGRIIALEKFSSMGNGFTFELESLIFYSLAWALARLQNVKGTISVYGDDVILPSLIADDYAVVCADLGFRVNRSKSYSSTYYRESCGSHYWFGTDIKPIFQKEPLHGTISVCKSANSLRRYAHRRNNFGCDHLLRGCWQILADNLGPRFPRISDGYGDLGLVENIDGPFVSFTKPKHQIEGFFVKCYVPVAAYYVAETRGVLLAALRTMGIALPDGASHQGGYSERGYGNNVAIPMRTRMSRMRILIPRWADLGPWL